jgi:phage/plasmid primase-like uncharacterized protein
MSATADPLAAFRAALADHGLVTDDEIIGDGQSHRLHIAGDKPGDRTCWYVLHLDDHPAGAFGDYKRNIKTTWKLNGTVQWTAADVEAVRRLNAERERARADARTAAAGLANHIWATATPVRAHPYCARKGVTPPACVRSITRASLASVASDLYLPGDGDLLVVPIYRQQAGVMTLSSLEFIARDGEKSFLTNGAVRAGFCVIDDDAAADIVAIAEGFATAASVHAATTWPAVIAFFASNLRPVAEVIRAHHPSATIVIAADRDANQVGETAGAAAATAIRGVLAVSPVATDWNDLQAAEGLESVAAGLHAIVHGHGTARTTAVRPTLATVETTFARWIPDADHVPTRAVLVTYLANKKLDGDPVWLLLVGGSGVGKTERLIPLASMPDVVLASSISGPAALLSASSRKDITKGATGGLLRRFPDGRGALILKDFTSIIDMPRDARAEVLAALREIYDGRWDRSVGTDGGRTLTWVGRLGLIAGCTTAIDAAHAVIGAMGTRFVTVRLRADSHIAQSVLDHVGHEETMRRELAESMRTILSDPPSTSVLPTDDVRDQLAALGSYVALARSPVDRDQRSDVRLVLDPEAPTRIVKTLAQLYRASGLLGLDAYAAWELVQRVGLDSIPKLRRLALDHLAQCLVPASTTSIAEAVEHPTQTTRRVLEDLTLHRLIRRIPGDPGKADCWELLDRTRAWLEITVPGMSGSAHPSS